MQYRATFASRYAIARQPHKKADHIRLMDCNIVVFGQATGPQYLQEPATHEFAVIDQITREKAFFEKPRGFDADQIAAMIAGHFGASPTRITDRLWIV